MSNETLPFSDGGIKFDSCSASKSRLRSLIGLPMNKLRDVLCSVFILMGVQPF